MDQALLDKIAKLKALADRAGTEAEAASAAAKVAELCERHNIDIGSVRLGVEETEATDGVEGEVGPKKPHTVYLANAVKMLFGVGSYVSYRFEPKVNRGGAVTGSQRITVRHFYGLKANVSGALLTYRYLVASVESLLTGWAREGNSLARGNGRAFRCGCASRILNIVKGQQAARPALSGESLAIVHLGNVLIQKHAKLLGLEITSGRNTKHNVDAFGAGWTAGARVDIHGARTNRMLN